MSVSVMELSPGEVREEVVSAEAEPWQQILKVKLMCHDCREDPPNIAEQHADGDLVCASCGNVLAMHTVDTRSEWRSFQNDDQGNDDPSRVGAAHNPIIDLGPELVSGIQYDSKSAVARDLSRIANKNIENKGNKQLQDALDSIGDYCATESFKVNVGNVAKQIYKASWDSKKFRSKNQEAIIAGCIFLACRQENSGRTFKEISKITKVPKKEIGRIFKQLENFMADRKKTKKGAHEAANFHKTEAIDPKTLCTRFGAKLDLPSHIAMTAGECAILLSSTGLLAGRSPLSVAAVALYAYSHLVGHPCDLKSISKAASVSEGTIKSAWKSVYPKRDKFILPEWLSESSKMENLPSVS